MNKEMQKLLKAINDKKNEVKSLVKDGKLDKARTAKDELKELQEKFDLLFDLDEEEHEEIEDKVATGAAKTIGGKADKKNLVKAFVNIVKCGFLKREPDEGDVKVYKDALSTDTTKGDDDEMGIGVTVPEDIRTDIIELRRSEDNLEQYVNVENVTTKSGSRNIEVNADSTPFDNVDEEADFPDMDEPKFKKIAYAIKKKGGILKITAELFEDTASNVMAYINKWIAKKTKATRNAMILKVADEMTKGKEVVWSVDPTDCANVESNPDVKLLSQPSTGIDYVGMNTQKEKFSDKRVRQAINYALDKQTFVDTIIEGRGLVANSYINAAIPGWTDEVEAYPYDPEKAKELLAEAGYPDGFECSIFVNGDLRTRSAQILQAQLADVGIKVDISTYEWGALLDTLNAGEHEMFLLGWSNTSFDPDGSTYQLFYSGNHGATGNRAFFSNDKVDELILSAQRESEESKRMELYKELQFVLHDESPWCPLYYKENNVGVRADLKGFTLHAGAQHYLGNCHYEE